MTIIKRIEYYVEYFTPPPEGSLDTVDRRYTSRIFFDKNWAEEFKKSMLAQGATRAEVKSQEYLYEQ